MLLTTENNKIRRWILPKPIDDDEIHNCKLNYTLQKVLSRRGFNLEEELAEFLNPTELPSPEEHFTDLHKATNRIIDACNKNEKIAICGDYDADGITSTVLLIELLSKLGAEPIPYIPSSQDEGYGLNIKMINDINLKKIRLAITVDNGISAFDAIKKSNELGIDLIITDHHKISDINIDLYALIHPEKCPINSPYKYLAGVGIAYMLARNICEKVDFDIEKVTANVLFCIGTVADMAPLIGANRKWLKESLPKINTTTNIGIRAIIKKLSINNKIISSDDIGYKIAPLINAVGRISDPNIIIDLLTNTSEASVRTLIKECFSINKERKRMTSLVEIDAMKIALDQYLNNNKFLVISNRLWHPGIIGIVAARIAENYNLPTAILSQANDGNYRGSVRSNNQLMINHALDECSDILVSHGGHSAAGGFTIKEKNIPLLNKRLNKIANRELQNLDLGKSIKPDAHLCFKDINYDFYRQLMLIGPFGIMNKSPIFWTRKCRILKVQKLKGSHLKLKLDDGTALIDAIKWNFSSEILINDQIDIAYNIELNNWKNSKNLQLNIIDIKKFNPIIELKIHKSKYKCQITKDMNIQVTNSNVESISSALSVFSDKKGKNSFFEKKILSFAEIALGKTA